MEKMRVLIGVIFFLICINTIKVSAQCAMCSANAENSVANGNKQGLGLNDGILYLLAAPYLAVGVVGFVWYKKYRRKNIPINIKEERINLN